MAKPNEWDDLKEYARDFGISEGHALRDLFAGFIREWTNDDGRRVIITRFEYDERMLQRQLNDPLFAESAKRCGVKDRPEGAP